MEISEEALQAQQQVVRLQALLEASRQLHSTIELGEVLHIALEIVVRELELDGAFFTTFPQTYGEVPAELQTPLSAGPTDPVEGVYAQALLRFPLCDKAGVRFTELIVLLPPDRVLDLDETDFLESLAVQASVAIENARFHERALQWQRVESDLAAARQVQLSLIPQQMPEIPNYHLAARSVTCYEVGGDYLDIVSEPSGKTMIVVADVAGKGLASALIGSSFRSAIRAMVHAGLSLHEMATKMNLLHYGEGEEARHRYVTGILFRLDPATHTLEAINAGHTPAFAIAADGTVSKVCATGTPFGLLPFSNYVSQTLSLTPGMRLLAYTDGMTEVFHGEDEFGEQRLQQAFLDCTEPTPDRVLASIWKTLEAFSDGQDQSDDMTALVLFRNPEMETAPMHEAQPIELQIPSRLGYEKIAMDAAADVARLMGFADERIEDLKTAVAEACINAMEHGNKFDETLSVGIIFSKGTDSLEVKVVDTGTKPLGQVAVPDIDKKMQEQEQPRGMGMFLIESLVDEVEWGNTPRSGNFARMVIRLRPAEE
jgi:serine phosphatase RsbU (regulator of sigma subunit)/anti-sigma regulatory factor (Ser/Thr protein kinase)